MTAPPTHPSFLELDRAALGKGALETAAHVDRCPRCQSYTRTVQTPPPLAPWVGDMRSGATPARMPQLVWFLGGGLAVAVVLVAGLRLWLAAPTPDALQVGPLVAAKGSPAVGLYIKREERVFLWDGRSTIRVGDRIQLEVAPGGFNRLTVASIGAEAELLYAGSIDAVRPEMLPVSFLVDAKPGAERLALGLSHQELTADALVAAAAAHRRDESLWTTELTLPKETQGGDRP